MTIDSVSGRKQWRRFVELPYRLYKNDPLWIPPLRMEQRKLFNPQKNSMLQHCDFQLFLAQEGGRAAGRAAAFIDPQYNAYWQEKTGFFGSFECVDEVAVAAELLTACQEWLRGKGMGAMRGPISFETQNWGTVIDDDDTPPRLMSPYNPPYYDDLFTAFGLAKIKDLEIFAANSRTHVIPERFLKHKEYLIKKYHLSIRNLNMKNMVDEARIIVALSNQSLSQNWGYVPIEMGEAESIARDLKNIVWPELVKIVESDGRPIGFCITLPDIMQLLKGLNGHLFPVALYRLLFKLRTIRVFRIWALGIVPAFQRKGIDTLLYLSIKDELKDIDALVEANYILEDNFAMKDAVVKLGMDKVRTLRIYEMPL